MKPSLSTKSCVLESVITYCIHPELTKAVQIAANLQQLFCNLLVFHSQPGLHCFTVLFFCPSIFIMIHDAVLLSRAPTWPFHCILRCVALGHTSIFGEKQRSITMNLSLFKEIISRWKVHYSCQKLSTWPATTPFRCFRPVEVLLAWQYVLNDPDPVRSC